MYTTFEDIKMCLPKGCRRVYHIESSIKETLKMTWQSPTYIEQTKGSSFFPHLKFQTKIKHAGTANSYCQSC